MRADEHNEVIAVTARAFWHDPLFDYFTRDLLHEYDLLPTLLRLAFRDLRPENAPIFVAEHDQRPRGVAGWLPPGSFPRSSLQEFARDVRAARLLARVRNRAQAARLLREVDHRHLREPHWYLAILATDPTVQGRGIGTALLAPVLERCDRDGIVAYTETQKASNVSWYARSGFAVTDEIQLPGTPTVWCLRRDPRTP
jgi:GNAT superfamily N-acetyltransferase